MRLILAAITFLLIGTTVSAEAPQVCKDYFERDSFADNDLHRGKSELVALLSDLGSKLPPSHAGEQRILAFEIFVDYFHKDLDDARQYLTAVEAVASSLSTGEVNEESVWEMQELGAKVYGVNDGDIFDLISHLGEGHSRAVEVLAVTDCYNDTLDMISKDRERLNQELAQHFQAENDP